jgi:hypothetical protein
LGAPAVFSSGDKRNKEGDREPSLLCNYLTMYGVDK